MNIYWGQLLHNVSFHNVLKRMITKLDKLKYKLIKCNWAINQSFLIINIVETPKLSYSVCLSFWKKNSKWWILLKRWTPKFEQERSSNSWNMCFGCLKNSWIITQQHLQDTDKMVTSYPLILFNITIEKHRKDIYLVTSSIWCTGWCFKR